MPEEQEVKEDKIPRIVAAKEIYSQVKRLNIFILASISLMILLVAATYVIQPPFIKSYWAANFFEKGIQSATINVMRDSGEVVPLPVPPFKYGLKEKLIYNSVIIFTSLIGIIFSILFWKNLVYMRDIKEKYSFKG